MNEIMPEKNIHRLFEIGVILKGVNALVEVVLGALLLFVDVRGILDVFIQNELVEDPGSFIATHIQSLTAGFSAQAELFAALYLMAHGIIKSVLVIGLLRNKSWAYPASLAVFSLFITYEGIKFLETRSVPVGLLTAFDLIVLALIWHEYRYISNRRSTRSVPAA